MGAIERTRKDQKLLAREFSQLARNTLLRTRKRWKLNTKYEKAKKE